MKVSPVLSHPEEPPESCFTTSLLILWFEALCSQSCKVFQCHTNHTSCFIYGADTIIWALCAHHSVPNLTFSLPLHFASTHLPLLSQHLTQFSRQTLSFLHLFCASHLFICLSVLFASLSSAPLHCSVCNHICITSCQFDRIHASIFCLLRRKWDWGFLSYLNHVSGGKVYYCMTHHHGYIKDCKECPWNMALSWTLHGVFVADARLGHTHTNARHTPSFLSHSHTELHHSGGEIAAVTPWSYCSLAMLSCPWTAQHHAGCQLAHMNGEMWGGMIEKN